MVDPGEQGSVTVNLNSTPGREIGSLFLYINFDPAIIDIQASDISLAGTPFAQWDSQSIPISVSNGRIQIVAFCFRSCSDYPGGSTTVATIDFTAVGPEGSNTDLMFGDDLSANQANVVGAVNPVSNLLYEPGSTINNGTVEISVSGCDPRVSAIDTEYPDGVSGAKDGNIDFLEASLYINNYECSFADGQHACDFRIPLGADGALDGNPNGYIDFGEVVLAINNYECSQPN